MTPSELLSCAPRIAPSKLARIRFLKCKSLGTLVPPGRDGKFLTIALDGKRGPPVRRLPKDVELVEQAAPPPPKLEPQCVNCGAVATLKCSACAARCTPPCPSPAPPNCGAFSMRDNSNTSRRAGTRRCARPRASYNVL